MASNFLDDLDITRGIREATDVDTIRKLLPGAVAVRKTDVREDKLGVDFVATLRRGAEVKIDSKTRRKGCARYWGPSREPQFPLELWSVMPGGKFNIPRARAKVGWTLSESTPVDMVLFAFDPSDSMDAWLIGFQALRMAFVANYAKWSKPPYLQRPQESESWQSQASFVPASMVVQAISDACRLRVA